MMTFNLKTLMFHVLWLKMIKEKKWKFCVIHLPYGDGQGEQGLFFIAYTKDLNIIDAMLLRMFGTSGDGIHDRMLHFVTPMDGAYYFAPSEELLEEVFGRLIKIHISILLKVEYKFSLLKNIKNLGIY